MKLGILGFGEVGFSFVNGFKQQGMKDILVFDKMWNDPKYKEIIDKRRQKVSINLQHDRKSLIEGSDIIIAVTTAGAALTTAKEVLPWLREGMVYADFNSASPMTKKKIATLVESTGALFVDGVIMTLPSIDKHKALIYLSGTGAKKFVQFGSQWGMNLQIVGDEPGQAATIKMFRSIWAKGIEALLIETLHAAHTCGVSNFVFASIEQFIKKYSFAELVDLRVISNVNHSLRRSYEMEDVVKTLKEVNVDATMSEAVRKKLEWSANLGLKDALGEKLPSSYKEVIRAITKI